MNLNRVGILHYSAPPVVGGVEAVIEAHAQVFTEAGFSVTVIAGVGEQSALPDGVPLVVIREMDSQNPEILEVSAKLEQGRVPESFDGLRSRLVEALRPILREIDVLIVHNVFTKHFNLPLTAALADLLKEGAIPRCLAWCHDFTWTSEHSRPAVSEGYPWDLLRTPLPGVEYITISEARQHELAELFHVPDQSIEVIYNGVDPLVWFGLSPEGWALIHHMDLLAGDIILLMPVRVTQAKNIELATQVVAELKKQACQPRLVVTGPPDPHNALNMSYYRSLLDLRGQLGLVQELRFVFEAQPPGIEISSHLEGYTISQRIVGDLLRVSDVLFMPSHREGFGMPVLEAGLVGVPVVASERIPAATEIGGKNVYLFNVQANPAKIASLILDQATNNPSGRFRRQVRHHLTWERIFQNKIRPLLQGSRD